MMSFDNGKFAHMEQEIIDEKLKPKTSPALTSSDTPVKAASQHQEPFHASISSPTLQDQIASPESSKSQSAGGRPKQKRVL